MKDEFPQNSDNKSENTKPKLNFSDQHFRNFEKNIEKMKLRQLEKLSNINIQKAMEAQSKMFSNINMQKAMEAQSKMFSNINMQKAMEAQSKMFNNINMQKVMEAQSKMFSNINMQKAMEAQSKMFSNINMQKAMEVQSKMFSNINMQKAMEVQSKLFDNSILEKMNKFSDTINRNIVDFTRVNIDKLISKNNLQVPDGIINYQIVENTITIDKKSYALTEIRQIISQVLDESGLSEMPQSINTFMNDLFYHISQLKESNLKYFIINLIITIIMTILITIFSPQLNEISNKIFNQNKNFVIKKLEKLPITIHGVNKEYFKTLRFVCVKVLKVRIKPSQKSQLIGKLYFGQMINVLVKKKNWSLIEYIDKVNDIAIKGWTFTRYIKKFK